VHDFSQFFSLFFCGLRRPRSSEPVSLLALPFDCEDMGTDPTLDEPTITYIERIVRMMTEDNGYTLSDYP
jgi:hypothetical protein